MNIQSDETRQQLQKRLSRIEGQVRGVRRMLDEDRDCRDIVQQIAAVRSAVQQVGVETIRVYAAQCLADPSSIPPGEPDVLDYVITTLAKWS